MDWKDKWPERVSPSGQIKRSLSPEIKTEIFIHRAQQTHGGKYTYENFRYINNSTKSSITCLKHGDFEQTANNHLEGKGCMECSGKAQGTTKSFIYKANKVHGGLYDYTKVVYNTSIKPVTIGCNIHGDFEQAPSNHLGGQGCARCYGNVRRTTEEFIENAREVHGDTYSYVNSVYRNKNTKLTIGCAIHGDFEQAPGHHVNSGAGCPKCGGHKQDTLYVLTCGEIHKIGITTTSRITSRVRQISNSAGMEFALVKAIKCKEPRIHETFLHKKFESKRAFDGLSLFDGSTECFNLNTSELEELWKYLETI